MNLEECLCDKRQRLIVVIFYDDEYSYRVSRRFMKMIVLSIEDDSGPGAMSTSGEEKIFLSRST